jgi:hypothetical protein
MHVHGLGSIVDEETAHNLTFFALSSSLSLLLLDFSIGLSRFLAASDTAPPPPTAT